MQIDARSLFRPAQPATRPLRYWAGIDGGGTGTRAVLADAQGRIVGRGEAGPSALGQGAEQAWQHILAAVQAAAAPATDFTLAEVALGLGLSGASLVGPREQLLGGTLPVADVALVNDGIAAVLGAHGGRPGAVLTAGTGAVGDALWPDGQHRQVSGWGWSLGDEGSGAWLGRRAMQHAQAALDGREPVGALARLVWQAAGDDRATLLAWCAQAGQAGFASLAPAVFELEHADAVAAQLLAQAVTELERIATALDPHAELPLALNGSIALRLSERLHPRWRERLVTPQADAAAGALHLIQMLRPAR